MHPITDTLIRQATDVIFDNWYGAGENKMSISLPNNKTEKKARYRMLIKQGSLTIQQAKQEYRRYLSWLK